MSNRTFCALLAGFLMLLGGMTVLIRKNGGEADIRPQAAVSSGNGPTISSPVAGWQVLQDYGMQYNHSLSQWEMHDFILLETNEKERVFAPIDGKIGRIEECPTGGVRVLIEGGEIRVLLWPVSGLCVFEGSVTERNSVIGTAEGQICLRVESNGRAVNPGTLIGSRAHPG